VLLCTCCNAESISFRVKFDRSRYEIPSPSPSLLTSGGQLRAISRSRRPFVSSDVRRRRKAQMQCQSGQGRGKKKEWKWRATLLLARTSEKEESSLAGTCQGDWIVFLLLAPLGPSRLPASSSSSTLLLYLDPADTFIPISSNNFYFFPGVQVQISPPRPGPLPYLPLATARGDQIAGKGGPRRASLPSFFRYWSSDGQPTAKNEAVQRCSLLFGNRFGKKMVIVLHSFFPKRCKTYYI